ncbi:MULTISPECIES: hypothetical protein [Pseudomonas]|uniref:Uncharacterized protein n=1 Tax=Pseudomonas tritici TaxID=2745518 RepID=A0A8I0CVY7_9PSED|nr:MULTISPECIES: hypothetical protein [Pseudomonas]MBP2871200.1 hypothetical protein [Pseudomonas sp. SWRI144]QXH83279.1 hypothetical protein HU722_0025450 [Pseudomonas tritici]
MTTSLSVIEHLEGELLDDAVLTPEDMARMNEARAAFRELKSILMLQVIPSLGGFENPLAAEIERRIEMVTFRSRNFLFPHRHAGAAHDAIHVGGRP